MNSMEVDETFESLDVFNDTTSDRRGVVDDKHPAKKSISSMERDEIISLLDKIDNQVEELRREAVSLQEKRDNLMTKIDMMKHVDLLTNLDDNERDDINMQLKRINERLQTVECNVQTVRDNAQVDSLHVVNLMIDHLIRFGSPISKRKKCQEYLNACSSSDFQYCKVITTVDSIVIDKRFETHLLGCTLDDQKRIKKRLENLLNYMALQMVHKMTD